MASGASEEVEALLREGTAVFATGLRVQDPICARKPGAAQPRAEKRQKTGAGEASAFTLYNHDPDYECTSISTEEARTAYTPAPLPSLGFEPGFRFTSFSCA